MEGTKERVNGDLSVEGLLPRIRAAFHSAFDVDPEMVTIDTTPNDIPAWDSMGHVNLASSLECKFGLSFDVDDLMEMENVKEICRVVRSKVTKAQGVQPQ
jgi:acyl carrier protein